MSRRDDIEAIIAMQRLPKAASKKTAERKLAKLSWRELRRKREDMEVIARMPSTASPRKNGSVFIEETRLRTAADGDFDWQDPSRIPSEQFEHHPD